MLYYVHTIPYSLQSCLCVNKKKCICIYCIFWKVGSWELIHLSIISLPLSLGKKLNEGFKMYLCVYEYMINVYFYIYERKVSVASVILISGCDLLFFNNLIVIIKTSVPGFVFKDSLSWILEDLCFFLGNFNNPINFF